MDELDLEARLRAHLHRRFDERQPSGELVAAVAQVVTTPPRRLGSGSLRLHARLGWSALAAAALVAALVVGLRGWSELPPGASAAPSPSPTSAATRVFAVLPPNSSSPSVADTNRAELVFTARLLGLGFGNFTSLAAGGVQFEVAADGARDDQVRSVLAATGDVTFVGLPAADVASGRIVPEVGRGVPADVPVLFDREGIDWIEWEDEDRRNLLVVLEPAAAEAFASYTAAHVGEQFAVLIDDEIALAPFINERISTGQVLLSAGAATEDFDITSAILTSGILPESWRDPQAIDLIPRDRVVADTLREVALGGLASEPPTLRSADLVLRREDGRWRAVWHIVLEGAFGKCAPTEFGETPFCGEGDLTIREFEREAVN